LANHLQTKKRIRQTAKRTERNKHYRTTLKGCVKRVRTCISDNNQKEASDSLGLAIKQIDKSVTKGILHRRTASRMISRLTVAVNKLQ